MGRERFLIGDVFSAAIGGNEKKFFQYVAIDKTQLDSHVIKVFKKKYPINEIIDLDTIVSDEVDFYTHVILQFGFKSKTWEKVGTCSNVEKVDVLFRDSSDYGNPQILISANWWIWKIDEPQRFVGKLEGENQKAEIGIVVTPKDIVDRMATGKYNFVYPKF